MNTKNKVWKTKMVLLSSVILLHILCQKKSSQTWSHVAGQKKQKYNELFLYVYISCCGGITLTVTYSDFAFPVLSTEDGLVLAPLLNDSANGALAVLAVIGGVLTQVQSSLIGYGNRKSSFNHWLSDLVINLSQLHNVENNATLIVSLF